MAGSDNRQAGGRQRGYNSVDKRYSGEYRYNPRGSSGRRRRRRSSRGPSGGPIILITLLVVLVCAAIVANNMGFFNTTLAKPEGGSKASSDTTSMVSNSSGVSEVTSGENSETSLPQSGVSSLPEDSSADSSDVSASEGSQPAGELEPPENGAAYTKKYTDMWVEKSEYIPHEEGDKVAYLTFDDGPCKSTDHLLDVLDRLDVKATFFYTAQFADREKLVRDIRKAYEKGHAVAVHTYSHDYSSIYSSVEAFLEDYKKMDDIILEATGERSKIYRYPGGSNSGYNSNIRNELLSEMNRRGFIYHDWNASNGDSDGYSGWDQVEKAVTEASYNDKTVILMHDTPGKSDTIKNLDNIVKGLKEKGYRFDIIDETVKPFQFATPEE